MKKNLDLSRFIWIPRIAAIAIILFLMLFSLDVFSMGGGILAMIGGFLLHSLPSILLAVILALFWNRPWVCGWVFIGAAVFFTFWFGTYSRADIFLLVSAPPLIVGVLFLIAPLFRRKRKAEAS